MPDGRSELAAVWGAAAPVIGRRGSSGCSPIPTTRSSASAARSHAAPRPARSRRSSRSPRARPARSATRRRRRGGRSARSGSRSCERSAAALGVDHVTCLDLGDGRLARATAGRAGRRRRARPIERVRARRRRHVRSRRRVRAPRPRHVVPGDHRGRPRHGRRRRGCCTPGSRCAGRPWSTCIVEWLTVAARRASRGTAAFGHALKLFADGTSMLGFAADHLRRRVVPGRVVHHRAGRAGDRAVLHPVRVGRRRRRARRRRHEARRRTRAPAASSARTGWRPAGRATPTSSPATT